MCRNDSALSAPISLKARKKIFYSWRARLQALTLLIVLLPMCFAICGTLDVVKKHLAEDISQQLTSDINAAQLYYHNEASRTATAIYSVSLHNSVRNIVGAAADATTATQLALLAVQYNLNFLVILDSQGRLLASPFVETAGPEPFAAHPLVAEVLATHKDCTATVAEATPFLLKFFAHTGKDVSVVPTLAIEAASPILAGEKMVGLVFGGILVTANDGLVGSIRDTTQSEQIFILAGDRICAASNSFPETSALRAGDLFPVATLAPRAALPAPEIRHYPCPLSGRDMVFELREVTTAGEAPPVAIVSARSRQSFDPLLSNLRKLLLAIFASAMLLAIFLTVLISRSIATPLLNLSRAMRKLQEGEVDNTIDLKRNDELGELIIGFNTMAATISERMRQLNCEIVQRQKAEEQLATESERLKVTLQSIGEGVITTDIAGRIVMMNKVAAELTGWSLAEARDRYAEEIFQVAQASQLKSVIHPVTRVLQEVQPEKANGDLLMKSRTTAKVLITESCAPLLDNRGQLIGTVLVFRDVTMRRKMEEEVAKAQKLESVGVLAGGIAHDFNNLLTAILGNLSLIKMMTHEAEKFYPNIKDAEKATMRARDLTQQLLTFSKGGAPVKKTVALNEIIQESARFIARGSNVKISFDINKDLWLVEADAIQIGQVIDNLVLNAIQAMKNGGELRVSATNICLDPETAPPLAKGKYIRISVADKGTGIPSQCIDKIFDPYFTTKESGNGLGLAICYGIVTKHGGHIKVESEEGKGATFSVYLPAALKQRETHDSLTPVNNSLISGKGRILVMDDEELVRVVAGSILQTLGYEVEYASDGYAALARYQTALAARQPFAAVLLDLTIPGSLGGKETLSELQKIDPGVRAIVCSGYSSDPLMTYYAEHGFKGAVVKPYRISELGVVLKKALA